uniref:RagB/SusD family nutrient uptake outer membrane protein n=1 Tax=uncultured Rothia sp. TaxID=316088 RepID=UPI00260F983D
NKFFSATGKPIGTMADRTWLSDIVFMRMAEIYLIASEAAARNGDDASAKTILLKLLKERTAADKYSAVETAITGLTHDELLEKIFYNWRVEMWGEGLALTVIKRFKYDNKRSARSLFFKEEAIKWDDPRLVCRYVEA